MIIDPKGPHHNKTMDILVVAGVIEKIETGLTVGGATVLEFENAHVSVGWIELRAQLGEPGFEDRETFETGLMAAAKGGFTRVATIPDTQPATDTASGIVFIKSQTANNAVEVWPLGAITTGLKGTQLAELYDMTDAGAVGFSDHKHPLENANLLKLALQYAKVVEKPIFSFPFDGNLARNGVMNEGVKSTFLGLSGMPNLSEHVMVQRDLHIQEYAGGHLHLAGISTKEAVALVAAAKALGQKVTADVSFYNLILTETALEEYDSNYKLNPPLRTATDVAALWQGLVDGTIDAISTDHIPWNLERKACEFEYAAFGMASIENAFCALMAALPKDIEIAHLVTALTSGPLKIFNKPNEQITIGAKAILTIFSPHATPQATKRCSMALNDPFEQLPKKGAVYATINKQHCVVQR